jgi:hypothetical protein
MMAQLIAARSNVDLAKTTDAATPRYVAAQRHDNPAFRF